MEKAGSVASGQDILWVVAILPLDQFRWNEKLSRLKAKGIDKFKEL